MRTVNIADLKNDLSAYSERVRRLVRDGKITARGLRQAAARLEVHRTSWIEVLPGDRLRDRGDTA